MKWSKYFIPTLKETPVGTEAVSHQLLLRAGLVNMLTSGVYSYLPLGLRVLGKIENIIREEMNAAGASELLLPALHPLEIWKKTGRDKTLEDVMFKFKDGKDKDVCLGPTHEEIITDLVKQFVQSYRQLPIILYQIQTKYRDELRPRYGIVRACEFIMKDAYSFDRNEENMKVNYQRMFEAYKNIFKRLDMDVAILEADSGAMGGDVSHEFMLPAAIGEDEVVVCSACNFKGSLSDEQPDGGKCPECAGKLERKVAIELGHIFQLGTKYSKALNACFIDDDGKQKPIIMGCYGIGVSRVIAAIIENNNDEKGIIWPKEIAPYKVEILPIAAGDGSEEILELSDKFYAELESNGLDVLVDDRNETAGRKFNDADLIGIPYRLVIGKRNLKESKVEIKVRKTNEVLLVDKDSAVDKIIDLINND